MRVAFGLYLEYQIISNDFKYFKFWYKCEWVVKYVDYKLCLKQKCIANFSVIN